MKKILLLALMLVTASLLLANRAIGYDIYGPVTVNSLLYPANLTAIPGNEEIYLNWDAPVGRQNLSEESLDNRSRTANMRSSLIERTSDSALRNLLGYHVYREGHQINSSIIEQTYYTDEELFNGVAYSYYVTAVYEDGESAHSNTIEATPVSPIPSIANISYPEDGEENVALNTSLGWTYTSNPAYTDPVGYKLQIGTQPSLVEFEETYISGGPGTHEITVFVELNYDTTYYWKVIPTTSREYRVPSTPLTRVARRSTIANRDDAIDCPIWSFTTEEEPLDNTHTGSMVYDPEGNSYIGEIDTSDNGQSDIVIVFTAAPGKPQVDISFTYTTNHNHPSVQLFPSPEALGAYFSFNVNIPEDFDVFYDGNVILQFPISPGQIWYRHQGSDWKKVLTSIGPEPPMYSYVIDLSDLLHEDSGFRGGSLEFAGDDGIHTLPVELSSFTAHVNSELYVDLQWTAETETNMLGYNVFRSGTNSLLDAIKSNFVIISAHNVSNAVDYEYTDYEVVENTSYYYWLESKDLDLTNDFHGPVSVFVQPQGDSGNVIEAELVTKLKGSYPNPFNPSTSISFDLAEPASVTISIYNLRGQLMENLVTGEHFSKGSHSLLWKGKDMAGRMAASGVYLYRMQTDTGFVETKKMILMK